MGRHAARPSSARGSIRWSIDGIVNLTAYLSGFGGLVLRKFQTGKVQTYVLFTVASVLVLYFVFRMV